MKILYISQRVPYPPNRGDKIAAFHAVRFLAKRHFVCVAALADSSQELENANKLRELGIEVEAAEHSPLQARWNAIKALPGRTPFSVAYFASRQLREKIMRAAETTSFDVVLAFSSSMAQYASCLTGLPLVADFVDLDSQKWALYTKTHAFPHRWLYREEARRLLAFERTVSRDARFVVVRTRGELEDCRRLIPHGRFRVVSNGVDLDYFQATAPKQPTKEIVFTGVMNYHPNVQAAVFFVERVLPLIRREVPEATFTIVGSRPVRRVVRLARRAGITVTGTVPDVRPYLQRARVAVAPLSMARGIQNKVLEALAMATPAVVSSAVFRGIDAEPEEGIAVADEPTEIAARVVEMLRDRRKAELLGRAGRNLVERRYVWEHHLNVLESLVGEAATGPRYRTVGVTS